MRVYVSKNVVLLTTFDEVIESQTQNKADFMLRDYRMHGKLSQPQEYNAWWPVARGNYLSDEKVFICPLCLTRSHNPNDLAQGYCGRCRDFTRAVLRV